MKAITSLAAVLIVFAGSRAEEKAPEKYVSKDFKYAIQFPGKTTSQAKKADSVLGKLSFTMQLWQSRAGDQAVIVSVVDYPVKVADFDAQKGLDAGAEEIGKQDDTKMGKIEEFEFGKEKFPARRFLLEKPGKKLWVRNEMIIKDVRMYHVLMVGSKDFVTDKAADAIFASFEITM